MKLTFVCVCVRERDSESERAISSDMLDSMKS